uniref:Uncharacterized protein n=1 Tax=Ciona savignyi TaxID=51511 RepID=H2YA45_CIOSA
MDKLRSISHVDGECSRRASHAGFDSARIIDADLLRRRGSLPVTFNKKPDTSRRIHSSSACLNLINEFKQIKIVQKTKGNEKKVQTIDPALQEILRRQSLRKTTDDVDNAMYDEDDVKRSSSVENLPSAKT